MILNGELRSMKRVAIVMQRAFGLEISPNTVDRITLEVGDALQEAEQAKWKHVLQGEVPVPALAIVEFDGGRIRTRKTGCGPGVHLEAKGWNETKNAIFVSATSETSAIDPQPEPPICFLDPDHVAKLTEQAKTKEKAGPEDALPNDEEETSELCEAAGRNAPHKPKRLLRTVISSMKTAKEFGQQMQREATRRRFGEATRKAFVADGLLCNWSIHEKHFKNYTPILDFTHAVSYLFAASIACFGKSEEAWATYRKWLRVTWQGNVAQVIEELKVHQTRMGLPPEDGTADDPRELLRQILGYLNNNSSRMKYDAYRRAGLPTTSAWMESAVKEMNYRIKGTEMFWNNPQGAEAILQIRAAALSEDDRLVRFLTRRPGRAKLCRPSTSQTAA